jgi:intracellular septation protein A
MSPALVDIASPSGASTPPFAPSPPHTPSPTDAPASAGAASGLPRIREVLPALQRGAVRFFSAGALPVITFYAAFRLGGPVVGILAGMAVSLAVLSIQAVRLRRLDPIVIIPIIVILAQGVLASVTGSVEIYLAAPAAEAVIWGVVLVGSVLLRRPLVPLIARELGMVPERFAASAGLHRSLKVLTLAWGVAAFVKAGLRLWLLTWLPLEAFLVAAMVGIAGVNVVMMGLSVWLPLIMVRRDARPPVAA